MVPCLVVPVLEASCAQVIQPRPLGGEVGLGAFGAGFQRIPILGGFPCVEISARSANLAK
jgi:hypothetical protein